MRKVNPCLMPSAHLEVFKAPAKSAVAMSEKPFSGAVGAPLK